MSTFDQVITELAASDVTVLLLGERGVGKHLVARQIHDLSPWKSAPFLRFECRASDDKSVRQAFGDGEIDSSEAYTVYFENIEELSSAAQKVLLSCIEAKEGQMRWPRVIASGSSELETEVRTGRLREDLFYKLSGVCLPIAPLRYRKQDIGSLADEYLERYAKQFNRPKPEITPTLLKFLQSHPWTGNLNELDEAMRTVVAIGNVRVAIAALHSAVSTSSRDKKSGPESVSLKQVARAASQRAERELILKVLTRTRWNRKKAAEELQISYKALLYKMKDIGSSPGIMIDQGGKAE